MRTTATVVNPTTTTRYKGMLMPKRNQKDVYPKERQHNNWKDTADLISKQIRGLKPENNLSELYKNLPFYLNHINKTIEKSKFIYDLKDDWDDEGSKGYKKETWIRSVNFIS